MKTVARAEHVTKVYGEGAGRVEALKGVDLNLPENSFTVLAGPSGSGKTTLMNLFGALDRPTSGTIFLGDHNLGNLSEPELARLRLHTLGFVFQACNLLPVLSIQENAEFLLQVQGVPSSQWPARISPLLKQLGLESMAHRRPGQLSGGQQQRAAILRALCGHPRLVLADEPTASLDSKTSAELLDLMLELNQKLSISFLVSSHDPLVLERARTLVKIRDGLLESP